MIASVFVFMFDANGGECWWKSTKKNSQFLFFFFGVKIDCRWHLQIYRPLENPKANYPSGQYCGPFYRRYAWFFFFFFSFFFMFGPSLDGRADALRHSFFSEVAMLTVTTTQW